MTDTISSPDATPDPTEPFAPWTLSFEGDEFAHNGVIRDSRGQELVISVPCLVPQEDEPGGPIASSLRLMTAAPQLLEALDDLLCQTVDQDLKYGLALSEGEQQARAKALAAIALAKQGES